MKRYSPGVPLPGNFRFFVHFFILPEVYLNYYAFYGIHIEPACRISAQSGNALLSYWVSAGKEVEFVTPCSES